MEKEERCRSSQGASQAPGRTSLAEMIETERHGIEARELEDDEVSDWSMVVNVSTCGSCQNEADLQADPDETYFSDNDEEHGGDVIEDEHNNTRSPLSTQDPEDEQEQFADCMEFSSSDEDDSKHKTVETSKME